jgi:translation initiation factor 2B subunit (eIF-2B alpha/beta/delta family)
MARIPADVEAEIDRFCNSIKQSTYTRSTDMALATIFIFKKIIGESKWSNASELITLIRSQAHRLNEGQPIDSITFNITRYIINKFYHVTESETNRTFPVRVRFGSIQIDKVRFEPTKIVKERCNLAF